MKKTLIFSVPGTGTRTACKYLEWVLRYRVENATKLAENPSQNRYSHVHTDFRALRGLVSSIPRLRIVVPLRQPYRSFITRTYRTGYTPDFPERNMPKFQEHWLTMIREVQSLNVVYLPVDSDLDRYSLLQSIANHCEAEPDPAQLARFVSNWPKIGSLGSTPEKIEYLEKGTVLGEKLTFLDFAVEWYQERLDELEAVL